MLIDTTMNIITIISLILAIVSLIIAKRKVLQINITNNELVDEKNFQFKKLKF